MTLSPNHPSTPHHQPIDDIQKHTSELNSKTALSPKCLTLHRTRRSAIVIWLHEEELC